MQCFKTLGDSFALLFKNYILFVPLLISTLLSLVTVPLFYSLNLVEGFSPGKLVALVVSVFILGAVSFIMHLWLYGLIKMVIERKKVSYSKSFKQGMELAPNIILVSLIVLGLGLIAVMIGGIAALLTMGIFYLSSVAGFIVATILILCGSILLIFFGLSLSYVWSIIIVENKGPWEIIKLSYYTFMRHKSATLKLGLTALLVSIIAYLPLLIFQILSNIFIGNEIATRGLMFSFYNQLLNIPLVIVSLVLMIYYTLAYLQLKKKK